MEFRDRVLSVKESQTALTKQNFSVSKTSKMFNVEYFSSTVRPLKTS